MKVLDVNKHFASAPSGLDINRSRFDRNHKHTTTFDAGKLVPFYAAEVLPGDSVELGVQAVVRMSTPIVPVMDNAYLDLYAFFVPRRLVWEHWEEFCGANKTGYWTQPVTYQVPWISDTSEITNPVYAGSVADHMGIPPGDNRHMDACYPRAYALVWNEFFRDQNLQDPAVVSLGDAGGVWGNMSDPITQAALGGALLPVCKLRDYFTSALPAPQKGPSVAVPVTNMSIINGDPDEVGAVSPIWYTQSGGGYNAIPAQLQLSTYAPGVGRYGTANFGDDVSAQGAEQSFLSLTSNTAEVNVTDLRIAFALQRMYERMARSGTRYRELLKSFFGVDNADARMQVPEYLGHVRQDIHTQQVVQTSGSNITGSDTPQGNVAAYSLTGLQGNLVNKGFTEHGILLVVGCVRTDHTYQQGISRQFSRKNFTDFYLPVFANLSEQPIYQQEIYASNSGSTGGAEVENMTVFGYQEAWAEYRYEPNTVSGEVRSSAPQSLDIWTYADDYAAAPTLTAAWIQESDANIQRTLAVQDHDQFIANFYFPATWTRPMPVYSVPGLIDHH